MATVETFDVQGLAGVLATLQALPRELASKRGGIVRAALRKAAVVLQKQVKANLAQIIAEPNVNAPGGLPANDSTGLLKKNIVVTRGKPPSGQNGEVILVRIRNKVYPPDQVSGKKPISTAQVARLLEYGTERRRAMPFIRPAFEAKKQEAVATFQREIFAGIDKAYRKIAAQNGQRP